MIPVLTGPLFRPLHAELIRLLRSLPENAWERPTSAGRWYVRDVAAHLLDGDLRRISVDRDSHGPPRPQRDVTGYADLLEYLNALNAEWVHAARRISARLITDLLETTGRELASVMENADPYAAATFPVAWATQQQAPAWLDIGREFTERWHHQDQIREAVGAEPLTAPLLLRPVLETSLHAVPQAYSRMSSAEGTTIALDVSGEAGGHWVLRRCRHAWRLTSGDAGSASCRTVLADLTLARLLLHRLDTEQIADLVRVEGDAQLAAPLMTARAVMV